MSNRLYVSDVPYNRYNAGMKAADDLVRMIDSLGGRRIRHPDQFNPIFKMRLFGPVFWEISCAIYMFMLLVAAFRTRKFGLLVLQYPQPSSSRLEYSLRVRLFRWLRLISRSRTYLFLHDVYSIRNGADNSDELSLIKEASMLSVHSDKMEEWLKMRGINASVQILDAMVYYCDDQIEPPVYQSDFAIAIAGNLDPTKCGRYISKLADLKWTNCHFKLFGNLGDQTLISERVRYMGQFHPDHPKMPDVQFGLIWDSDELNTCSGVRGNYLRYNIPHKMSLYIAAGIPVIIWSQANSAKFVKSNSLGLCIDSLDRLGEELAAISESDYNQMLVGVRKMRDRILCGEHLQKIVTTFATR